MKRLERVIGLLNTILIVLAGLALLALMGIAVTNVAMGGRLLGAQELMGFAGAIVIAASLGQTQISKDHVPVDIITQKFPAAVNRALDVLKYTLKCAFAAVVAWQTLQWGLQVRLSGEVSGTLKIPFYPFVFCVSAGFAVLACTVVLDIARSLWPAVPPSPAPAALPTAEEMAEEEVPLP